MQTIAFNATINENGNVHLPKQYRRLYGHQARFVVSPIKDRRLMSGTTSSMNAASELDRLLDRTRNIWDGGDGLAYQLSMREEWGERDPDERR
uniref:SpoVT-AbrB domain-containing protein n=1 Tax=Candidatus Kentrum sp. FW TaxID=2126338 RepID=A0A450TIV5_9GAMM|nr:MAG: hypothetical protein BECKFW1821C_GA0114237_101143 [Candidatus Kentron sp. FW]